MQHIQKQFLILFYLFLVAHVVEAQKLDTLVLQPGEDEAMDAVLWSVKPDNNYGDHPQINALAWTYSGIPSYMRSLIRFDLSQIPSDAAIRQVNLSLYHHVANNNLGHSQMDGSNESVLERVVEEWDENTVTWNTQPASTGAGQVVVPASTGQEQDYVDIDITGLVADSHGNLLENFGFLLSLKVESYYRSLVFASSSLSDSTRRPKLVVIYESTCDVVNNPVDLGKDTTLCQGQSLLLDATMPDVTYLWQDGSSSSSMLVTAPGTYWVEVTTCSGVYSDAIEVRFAPSPAIARDSTIFLCTGDTVILDATTPQAGYLWQDHSTGPTLLATTRGEYQVEITIDGCSSVHTFNLHERDCEVVLVLPNVFTPNSDGVNDRFVPKEIKGITLMYTTILNRWGRKIYTTDNAMIEWDAVMTNGKTAPAGVYFYHVYYTDILGNASTVKGNLMLLH